jgi:hypothetical protein
MWTIAGKILLTVSQAAPPFIPFLYWEILSRRYVFLQLPKFSLSWSLGFTGALRLVV